MSADEFCKTDVDTQLERYSSASTLTTTATLERLAADGVIGRATAPARPQASGQQRPRPRRPVADLVGDQRR